MALMGGSDVHNYYLRMLMDGGVLGFMLLLIGIFLIVRKGWRWYRESGEGAYFLPLVYLLVASFAGRALQYKIGWFFLAMNAVVPHVLSTRAVARRPGPTGADR
jgi:O-antigen ligase